MEQQDTLQIKACHQLKTFLADCKIENPEGRRILEIGFKNGLFLNECHKAGLIPTGIEINKEHYENTKSAYPDLDLIIYDGGTVPVPDESFDFVVSFQVLEHVKSIEHIFNECERILKPGGMMYHVCPNYHSFYEGHFKIIWLPFLNKTLGRFYLKLLHRYTAHYESLNPIKPKTITKILRHHKNNVTITSLGQTEFIDRFDAEQIEKIDQKTLKKILKVLLKFPTVKNLLLKIAAKTNLYYPLSIIATKNQPLKTSTKRI